MKNTGLTASEKFFAYISNHESNFPHDLFPLGVSNNLNIFELVKPLLEDNCSFNKVDSAVFKKHVLDLFPFPSGNWEDLAIDAFIYDRLGENGEVFFQMNAENLYADYNDKIFMVLTPKIIGLASMVELNKVKNIFHVITYVDSDDACAIAEILNDYFVDE